MSRCRVAALACVAQSACAFLAPGRLPPAQGIVHGLPAAARLRASTRARAAVRRTVVMQQPPGDEKHFEAFAYEGDAKNPVKNDPAGYALAAALQGLPLLTFADKLQGDLQHWTFFLGLATTSVYLGSRAPPLVPPEAKPLSMRQALLAPFFGAGTLGTLYYCITVLHIDPSTAYRIATTLFACIAAGVVFRDALMAVAPGLDEDNAERGAGTLALLIGGAYLASDTAAAGLGVAANNFLGFALCLLSVRSVPLRSFRVGGALLIGLFLYDVYFVFGTDIMMTVATKIDAPVKLLAPNPPGSASPAAILGLGDLAIPGLMVAFLARRGDALADGGWARKLACGAYAGGLAAAFLANEVVRKGQPALLYLVPAVLGSALVAAYVEGGAQGVDALLVSSEDE